MRSVKINITGVVQGVGFRPFIAGLAKEHCLKGYVLNTGAGVEIHAEGENISAFIADISLKKPARAHIVSIDVHEDSSESFTEFSIKASESAIKPAGFAAGVVFVPTDIAICDECAAEMFDPNNRRYKYPFINCTQCGPRYSIIESLPYDRASTTMSDFKMCPQCEAEYNDPSDRRYHAQPNACPVCGPQVWLNDYRGGEAITEAARLIDVGEIVAMRGVGGYHLICDATNDTAVLKLRTLKQRPSKPLAVMCAERDLIPKFFEKYIFTPEAPIVIFDWADHPLSKHINSLSNAIGVMCAYSPLHRLLLNETKTDYIVATSGNRHDEPIIADIDEAEASLSTFTPHFLHHNRPIQTRIDDSVATYVSGKLRLLRRGRGYAPFPVRLPSSSGKTIFATGAGLKSSITVTKGDYAFVSQYIGDLNNKGTVDFYNSIYEQMKNMLNIDTPDIVVCDKHKGYYSTSFAESLGLPLLQVQHHHAHMYATMAEHGLQDNVIAVIMDGTGYGDDGNIWGGEFFTLVDGKITREYHIQNVAQAGGDAAARYPGRMAISWLMEAGEWDVNFWKPRLGLDDEIIQINEMLLKNKITRPTSSAGRLFESVGAMLLGINKNEYEGHAAIALEYAADDSDKIYDHDKDGENIIVTPMIRQITEDIKSGMATATIAAAFHNSIAEIIRSRCVALVEKYKIPDVVLSGGVFQNKRLLSQTEKLLVQAGLNCYIPIMVPANDGAVSLGQAYYAATI